MQCVILWTTLTSEAKPIKYSWLDKADLFVWSLDLSKGEKVCLAAAMIFISCALLYGLNGDSPICLENDELTYAHPALIMGMEHGLNPHWFINPASTLLYPLAAYYKLLEILFGTKYIDPAHYNTMQMCFNQMPVLITGPRITSALEVVISLPFLYIIGRRWVGKVAAMLGLAVYTVCPMVTYYGQILRPDMLASLIIILTLFVMDFLCEEPTRRSLAVIAGILAGLAISTRFFCLALVPPIVLIFAVQYLRSKDRSVKELLLINGFIFIAVWFATFFLTSPFVFLDAAQVVEDLQFEAKSDFQELTGLGPFGNFYWYITYGIPYCIGEMLTGASIVGFIWMCFKPNFKTVIYLFLLVTFFVGTCLNPRHWERWVLPMLPIMVFLAGVAITRTYDLVTTLLSKRALSLNSAKNVSFICLSAFTVTALFFPFRHLILEQYQKGHLSARAAIFPYIKQHIPKKTKIALDMEWGLPDWGDYNVKEEIWRPDFVPPRDHNYYFPIDLAREGYEYMLVRRWNRDFYRDEKSAVNYPREYAFYNDLYKNVPLLIDTQTKNNPVILGEEVGFRVSPVELYDLRPLIRKIAAEKKAKDSEKPSSDKSLSGKTSPDKPASTK